MNKVLILAAAAVTAFAQQGFDFKVLDKLGANATESTNITLDGNTLKLASAFLGDDKDVKDVVKNLKGIYIRSFEFAKSGQYKEADLAPLRAYLKSPRWNKIVDVKETDETSEIYLLPLANGQLGGLAIISAEPKELTVVFIEGVLNMDDIGKLSGNMGIPEINLPKDEKKSGKTKKE
ncbi:MAG TPA: DUF4252 domain-containing protein [Bryobacteraceae bacterium]|jgi:hypothetical protein|nr:DUF4252 domain-containing protein [Bryobacteraceae bacterium]